MIVGEREIHHRADLDLAVDHHRTLLDLVHSENRDLRRIQDRRRHERTEHAAVRKRERAAGELIERDRAVASLLRIRADRGFDLREAHVLGVAQHGHHEPAIRRHRDTDVVELVIDDVVAVDRSVHGRELAQRLDGRLDEERHEAELHAVRLLELLFVARTNLTDGGQVDLIERRQHCGRRLRLNQALGDASSHSRHRHALLAARAGRRRQRCARCARFRLFLLRLLRPRHVLNHIALRDAPVAPASGDLSGIELVLFDHALRGRCELRGRSAGRFGFRLRLSSRLRLFRRRARRSGSALLQNREHLSARDSRAVLDFQLLDHARRRRRNFEHDLVGFEIDEILVPLDRVAGLLVPRHECCVGDRFGQWRNFDFDAHADLPLAQCDLPAALSRVVCLSASSVLVERSAASTRPSCCSTCI